MKLDLTEDEIRVVLQCINGNKKTLEALLDSDKYGDIDPAFVVQMREGVKQMTNVVTKIAFLKPDPNFNTTVEAIAWDDPLVERVAKAIAEQGFGRNWDDFMEINSEDTDQSDLQDYARAAIAEISNTFGRDITKD